ncbi:unnamed protein product [Meloidogyne enterolobii]|uniref:Uncharacterized protein n=1 Tax=Meloidogyne enterolobii TaxID=390850 RepID=A0ACB0YHN6_MELEN
MLHGERPLTKGGNPAPPPMSVYLEWIVNAWEKLPRDLIAQSFKTCGITNDPKGSEDHLISCLKESNGMVNLGLARIDKATVGIESMIEAVDLDQDDENGILSDASIDFDI